MTLANDPTYTVTIRFNLTKLTLGDMVYKAREENGTLKFYSGDACFPLVGGALLEGELMVTEDYSYRMLLDFAESHGCEMVEMEEFDGNPDPVEETPLRTAATFGECDPVEDWTACSTCHELFMLHGLRTTLSPDDTEAFVPSHRPPQAQPKTTADEDSY